MSGTTWGMGIDLDDAVITVRDLRGWSGIDDLSDAEIARVIEAIPNSMIPGSVADIAFAVREHLSAGGA
ncbi:hypothetical protein BH769_gp43 [Gordonia phage BritBrat]|uniref:Uncharacterized protein n=1 Tax=Gordonia phage BritBrat TaxID=1838064 RepID=A0A166Y162_9CAUD|nr:hypothetical protein BH769_gp43 [Gordonia phage BritBrat]ANA85301.1 hypothetical protein PBI_BRITBRAT_43 [Gordonia phage BritBrat]